MTTDLNKPETQEKAVKNIKPNIGLEQDVLKKDNELLNAYLADLHVLYIKTRKYHWNVAGPSFKEYHEFFEEQYTQLEQIIDQVAERIRTLGVSRSRRWPTSSAAPASKKTTVAK